MVHVLGCLLDLLLLLLLLVLLLVIAGILSVGIVTTSTNFMVLPEVRLALMLLMVIIGIGITAHQEVVSIG